MKTDIAQLEYIHPKLRQLSLWLESETGLEFTETSRHRVGDPGVHGQLPVRGQDLRMRSESVGNAIVDFINDNWAYDPSRLNLKCALLHGEGANMHIHLQVHPNTEKI